MQMVTKEDVRATLKALEEFPNIPIAAASNRNSGIQMHIRPPFSHNSYFGLAQLLGVYPKGRMIRTPYSKSELIVGVEFGIPWINASSHNYLNAVQPPSERLQRLREVNTRTNQRIVPFFSYS